MLAGQEFEGLEILEEYEGRVVVLGHSGLKTSGPFLTEAETAGGKVRIYHQPREDFSLARMVGIEIIPTQRKPTFLRTYGIHTDEPILKPAYVIPDRGFFLPLGQLFGYRSDLALAERLGVTSLHGQHEGMITSGVFARIARELGI